MLNKKPDIDYELDPEEEEFKRLLKIGDKLYYAASIALAGVCFGLIILGLVMLSS